MRFKTLVFIIFVFLFVFSGDVSAYNDSTTHPALTREIAEFYNSYFNGSISPQEISLMMTGATNEDAPPRYVNHFYDPIYDEGWKGELLKIGQGKGIYASLKYIGEKEESGQYYAPASVISYTKKLMGFDQILPSYQWINNRNEQAKYDRYWGDQSWGRAVNAYATGDKESAFIALGHILHALEDATVPEHTRNDTHANEIGDGSPYENWAHEYTKTRNNNLDTAENLTQENKQPPIYQTVKDYFYNTAKYTNTNFFSKDTILIEKYSNPLWYSEKIISGNNTGKFFKYGLATNGSVLIKIEGSDHQWLFKDSTKQKARYSIEDDLILSSYFHHLSRQAVLNGAGLLNLFFAQAEELKAKVQRGEIALEKEKARPNKKIFSLYGETNQLIKNITNVIANLNNLDRSLFSASLEKRSGAELTRNELAPNAAETSKSGGLNASNQNYAASLIGQNNIGEITPGQEIYLEVQFQNTGNTTWNKNDVSLNLLGDFPVELERTNWLTDIRPTLLGQDLVATGETGVFRFNIKTNKDIEARKELIIAFMPVRQDKDGFKRIDGEAVGWRLAFAQLEPEPEEIPTEPKIAIDDLPSPQEKTSEEKASSGETKESDKITDNDEETNAKIAETNKDSQEEETSANPNPPTRDWAAGQISIYVPPPLPPPPPDTTPPDPPNIAIIDCSFFASSLSVNWNSTDDDFLNFDVDYKAGSTGIWTSWEGATTLISKTFSSPDNFTTYYFRARARDAAGNAGDYAQTSCEINSRPVVVSEVAWMGTGAASDDEWMELHNPTSQSVNLAGWTLRADGGTPGINLSGTIQAGGYFLLERTANTTISDVSADMIYTGALNNSGPINLRLKDAAAREIDFIDYWYAGDNALYTSDKTTRKTMERVNAQVAGDNAYNWRTNRGAIVNGQDADGNNILGTPRAQNSVHNIYYAVKGNDPSDSSYTNIIGNVTWAALSVPYFVPTYLTVASGATLTIDGAATIKFNLNTRLTINGTLIINGSSGKEVIFTSVKDGFDNHDSYNDGLASPPAKGDWQYIYFNPSSQNSVINYALIRYGGGTSPYGAMEAEETGVSVNNSTFTLNNHHGLGLKNSNSTISNSVFSNHFWTNPNGSQYGRGLYIEGGSPTIQNSSFTGNYYGLVAYSGAAPILSGNTFTSNIIPAYFYTSYPQTSGTTMTGNNYNGLRLGGTFSSNFTLSPDNVPYLFSDVVIANGATLALNPGVIVKVWTGQRVNIQGALMVNGASTNPVVFTSLYDDAVGGDTDNGLAGSAIKGQWEYLNFTGSAVSSLTYTTVRYGGGGGRAVNVGGSPVTFANVTIEKNAGSGIYLDNADNVSISNSVFFDHADTGDYAALYLYNSDATLTDTVFRGNRLGIMAVGDSAPILSGITFESNTTNTYPASLAP